MQERKRLTGYPSIDKPWLKYYSEEQLNSVFEEKSIYQMMRDINKEHESDIALNYFRRRISFGELFRNINRTASALRKGAVKKGDVVIMILPNIPEAVYLFYAVNLIGAVLYPLDPRMSAESIQRDIHDSDAKMVFALDMLSQVAEKISEELRGIKWVAISPFDSMSLFVSVVAKMKSKFAVKKFGISWKEFQNDASYEDIEEVYEKHQLAIIIHTGGSTGTPKGVMLTNESCNALVYQCINLEMNATRKHRFLNILPPFIALGVVNATHLAACKGFESVLIPSFAPEDYPELLLKHKPNAIMAGPIHYKLMLQSDKLKKANLSFLRVCVCGGDALSGEEQEEIQNFIEEREAEAKIWLGYGATEMSSGAACMRANCFRYGSVGIPYLHNVFKVVDPDSGEELQGYGVSGELYMTGPTMMLGYVGNYADENREVIVTDMKGKRWYRTGDLAHFDEDGCVYIDGRIKRIIVRRGFKIYPQYVEKLILEHRAVKECAVVGVSDADEISIPVANIVLKDGMDSEKMRKDVIAHIQKRIASETYEYMQMAGYNFLETLPLTAIGKLDFKKLEEMGIMCK